MKTLPQHIALLRHAITVRDALLPKICEHPGSAPLELALGITQEQVYASIKPVLACIPPAVDRSTWLRVGMALHREFRDAPEKGLALFGLWSEGALCPQGCPDNYEPYAVTSVWDSISGKQVITAESLIYLVVTCSDYDPILDPIKVIFE